MSETYYVVMGDEFDVTDDGAWVNRRPTDSVMYGVTCSLSAAIRKVDQIAEYWMMSGDDAQDVPRSAVRFVGSRMVGELHNRLIRFRSKYRRNPPTEHLGRHFYVIAQVDFAVPLEMLADCAAEGVT